jgi:hypothetical protein
MPKNRLVWFGVAIGWMIPVKIVFIFMLSVFLLVSYIK